MNTYVGRFAPSPTGDLHAGSLACALASYLDAKAHGGKWLIRIEDIDPPREPAGCAQKILDVLQQFELNSDEPVLFQSTRLNAYQEAFQKLRDKGLLFECSCSRREIRQRQQELNLPEGVYPGTCRNGAKGNGPRAWRFMVEDKIIQFQDRIEGSRSQNLLKEVGDFILKRADGLWAYQLAVVVDDQFQGVNNIVRGADLLDNTERQIALQQALGYPTPTYMHIPLVLNEFGQKLSKQRKAEPVKAQNAEQEILKAWVHLGFEPFSFDSLSSFYKEAAALWKQRYL